MDIVGVLPVEEFSSLDDFEEIFKHIDFGGECAEIKIDILESKETNPCERQAEMVNSGDCYGQNVAEIQNFMSFQNSRSVTWKEGEAPDTFSHLTGEGSVPDTMVPFSTRGNSSLPSLQVPFDNSDLQQNAMSVGKDRPLSFRRSALDAFDLDNLSSPGLLSLDASLVEKLVPSSPVSPFPKFESLFLELTQANETETQACQIEEAENTDDLNVNNLKLKSVEIEMDQVNRIEEEDKISGNLCQFNHSIEENCVDNCFHPDSTQKEENSENYNGHRMIQNKCPANAPLDAEHFEMHSHAADFTKGHQVKEKILTSDSYKDNHAEQQNFCCESSPAIVTEWKENASPLNLIQFSDYVQNQPSSLGSAGSGIQQTRNKQDTPIVEPLQRVDLKNLMDAKEIASNLQRSLSGVSSNRQKIISAKRYEKQADGLPYWKRERPISLEISLTHGVESRKKKQKVEAAAEDSVSILNGNSESEDPRLRPGINAANAVLNILYPQIFFLLNRFTRVENDDERQVEVNKLLDLELQSLVVQHKLPADIASALSSSASLNRFPFSTDLPLIRNIHHELLTQLQGMEARACIIIKDTIRRFHFLHSNSSEVCHLKTSSLKALCRQHRAILLKSFRDNLLLQHSKEVGSTHVQNSLKSERLKLCSTTRQNPEVNLGPASATPSSREFEPPDASVCDLMTSTTASYCTGEEIIDSSTDASRRKRLPKEACVFMDKYLLTNRGRIKRGEKEAIARLLKLTFKQLYDPSTPYKNCKVEFSFIVWEGKCIEVHSSTYIGTSKYTQHAPTTALVHVKAYASWGSRFMRGLRLVQEPLLSPRWQPFHDRAWFHQPSINASHGFTLDFGISPILWTTSKILLSIEKGVSQLPNSRSQIAVYFLRLDFMESKYPFIQGDACDEETPWHAFQGNRLRSYGPKDL
eukprot:Gb_28636 [translate_table: standard]